MYQLYCMVTVTVRVRQCASSSLSVTLVCALLISFTDPKWPLSSQWA